MKNNIMARKRARFHAIQALYQRELAQTPFIDLKSQYFSENSERHYVDWDFFNDLLSGVEHHQSQLDGKIEPLVDKDFKKINPVELSSLRLATYEILYRLEIAAPIIINEYVNQVKVLGSEQGYSFINGLLDKLAKLERNKEEFEFQKYI